LKNILRATALPSGPRSASLSNFAMVFLRIICDRTPNRSSNKPLKYSAKKDGK
jgi:hypothetical protein